VALAVAAATTIIIAGKCPNVNTFFEFFSDFFKLFIFCRFSVCFSAQNCFFSPAVV